MKIHLTEHNFELILLSATRYALGRSTYIVHVVTESIKKQTPYLTDWALCNIIKDIKEALELAEQEEDTLGMEIDHEEWTLLYSFLKVEAIYRGVKL